MEKTDMTPVLSVNNLKKTFGTKTVVDDVSFEVCPGEIIALVGENGAGKSTLKNMLCGLLEPTEGTIHVEGKKVEMGNGYDCGISAVHQELSLFKSLTVAQNICISQLPGSAVRVNWGKVNKIANEQLDYLGADIDGDVVVDTLGMGKQQMVEIAKALLHADKFLILDEPTTSLTTPEREKLFELMFKLKERGVAMLFISHFLDEVFRMSDKFICLRDGKQVGSGAIKDITLHEMENMMVGRSIEDSAIDIGIPTDEEILRVEKLNAYDFENISFDLKKGEILGIQGLVGAGRTEVVESIFGLRKATGKIIYAGEEVSPVTVEKMMDLGVAFVTEDRKRNGIFGIRSVRENFSSAYPEKFTTRKIKGFGYKDEAKYSEEAKESMNVALPSIEAKIANLSGGNQQKVIIGKWLAANPNIVIVDEPTKGVDIGAKFEIHNKIAALARQGAGVILVSSDLPELLGLSHRILVMRTGHIVGEISREEFDSVRIISMAAGANDSKVSKGNE